MKILNQGVAIFKKYYFAGALVIILLLTGITRLYRLDAPLADWHSFRQADTASVTREYVKNGIDLFRPRYHDISNIQSGEFNPQGWRMVEFPLINALIAQVLIWNPQWDLVVTSRLASVLATVLAVGLLVDVVRRYSRPEVALLTGLVWALMPYAIYYGRVILPEPFLLVLVISTAWFLDQYLRKEKIMWLLVAGLTGSLALLVKPVAIFFAPWWLGMALAHRPRSLNWKKWLLMLLVALLGVLPLLWWRQWIQNFPTGIPASSWLLNGNGIRLRPAWWRWIFADRIGRLMFGYWGAPLLLLGLLGSLPSRLKLSSSSSLIIKFLTWLLAWVLQSGALLGLSMGMLAYLVVFASGNVQHDYYQILLLPLVSWLTASGMFWLYERAKPGAERMGVVVLVLFISIFSLAFSWYAVKDWFGIQNPAIVQAGQAVDRLTPDEALIIAPYMGDTAFLFQTNRRGWPLGFDIDKKIARGADYYVSTAYDDETNELMRRYQVVDQNDQYVIINLQTGE